MNHHGTVTEQERRIAGEIGVDVDDPIIRVLRPIARVETKIEQWTETNIKLLKLLTKEAEEKERLSQNYSQLGATYDALSKQLMELQTQIEPLNKASQTSASEMESLNVQLSNGIRKMNGRLQTAMKPLNQLASADLERRDWTWSVKEAFSLVGVLCILGLSFLALPRLQTLTRQNQDLNRELNSVQIRLQRLEEAAGTAPAPESPESRIVPR